MGVVLPDGRSATGLKVGTMIFEGDNYDPATVVQGNGAELQCIVIGGMHKLDRIAADFIAAQVSKRGIKDILESDVQEAYRVAALTLRFGHGLRVAAQAEYDKRSQGGAANDAGKTS